MIAGISLPSKAESIEAIADTEPSEKPVLREGAPVKVTIRPAQGLIMAQNMIDTGKHDSASLILDGLEAVPDDQIDRIEFLFLRGQLAFAKEDFDGAAEYYRTIIDDHPELVRVRLELARSLFEARHDRAAAYHFRLALAGQLPEVAIKRIRAFLYIIQKRKIWRISARASVVPDTNVAAAPRDPFIQLNGLQFELNDNALARSGIGVTASLFAEFFPRISKRWRLEARSGATFTDQENIRFDDLIIFGEAGPRYETENFAVSILATAKRRVFGGNGFNRNIGGKISFEKGISARTGALIEVGAADVNYDLDISRNGQIYFFAGTLRHALSSQSSLRSNLTITREQTQEGTLQNTSLQWRAGYRRELPWGISAEIGPDIYYRRFDVFDSLDGVRREDWTFGGSAFITKRDWRLFGFAPVFSYQYLRNESNADRFNFNRHRANVGVTRQF